MSKDCLLASPSTHEPAPIQNQTEFDLKNKFCVNSTIFHFSRKIFQCFRLHEIGGVKRKSVSCALNRTRWNLISVCLSFAEDKPNWKVIHKSWHRFWCSNITNGCSSVNSKGCFVIKSWSGSRTFWSICPLSRMASEFHQQIPTMHFKRIRPTRWRHRLHNDSRL